MKLTVEEIKKIATLARLELTPEQIETYGDQLSGVLDYVAMLSEVDTTDVEPTAQVTGLENVLRADEIQNWPEDEIEAALKDAPGREDRFIKVKRVIE